MTTSAAEATVLPPWAVPLTGVERELVLYAMGVAAFALGAMLLRQAASVRSVGDRYRPATLAGLSVVGVAFLSYLVLAATVLLGYQRRGDLWIPNAGAALSWTVRYMDWSVSVPLLVVEIIAVSAVAGATASRLRRIGVAAAFLMISTGYLGAVVVSGGSDRSALLIWGLISSVFFVVLYGVVVTVALRSLPVLPAGARRPYRSAMILLVVTWFVYPVLYGLQGAVSGGEWTTLTHLVLAATDVTAKVGFGLLLHRVARMRTAADVRAGEAMHPEAIWIDQQRVSDAAVPGDSGASQ